MKIAICGSMAFLDEMAIIQESLQKLGHSVVVPIWLDGEQEVWDNKEANPEAFAELKNKALLYYFDKVDWADAILVVNLDKNGVENYIGGNALMEIGLAVYLGKRIYFLRPVPNLPYHDELIGALPIILNDDLSLVTEPL